MKNYKVGIVVAMIFSLLAGSCASSGKAKKERFEGDFGFKIEKHYKDKSTITITSYNGNEKDVVIPSVIKKLQVKEIDSSAFENKQLNKITIPGSVTSIGDKAFANNQLSEVVFLENDNGFNGFFYIWDNAFQNNQLTDIKFPKKVTFKISKGAFDGNNFTKIAIPDNVWVEGSLAFGNNLNEVLLLSEEVNPFNPNNPNLAVKAVVNAFGDNIKTRIVFENGKTMAVSDFNQYCQVVNDINDANRKIIYYTAMVKIEGARARSNARDIQYRQSMGLNPRDGIKNLGDSLQNLEKTGDELTYYQERLVILQYMYELLKQTLDL
jgi:major membrane immunogen (membrane-anchored lipoprotein)